MTDPSADPVGSVPAQAGPPDRENTVPAGHATVATHRRPREPRHRWRRWRRTRPFWGALFVILGAVEILVSMKVPLPIILHIGLQGLAGFIIPFVLLLSGIFLLFQPQHRMFYSIIAMVLALTTWITSNLGGFIIGMLLALIGASLAFAWSPRPVPATAPTDEAKTPELTDTRVDEPEHTAHRAGTAGT
ncbi:MAG TPA: DUF6114 domain-containing protein [Micromonosporaceae bacterium]